jgi:murein DD-endopeptidase MepM/ murein hydrolase activator NlpD
MRFRIFLLLAVLTSCGATTMRAKPLVEVVAEKQGEKVLLYANLQNCLCASLEMNVDLTNMQSTQLLPVRVALTQPQTLLTTLSKRDSAKPWAYKYHFRYVIGLVGARPDPSAVYQLPFSTGSNYRVVQGYGGAFSHPKGTPAEYSIDWSMPVGTPVLAVRDGRVVGSRADSDENGLTDEFHQKANLIIVEHADGTFADYVHLKYGGVAVSLGQRVRAGDLIGYSGNTGYSKGAHLHVRVFIVTAPGYDQSIPVRWNSPIDFAAIPTTSPLPKSEPGNAEERVSSERSVDSAK